MLCQTVDQLLPLLNLLQQPAFCLRQNGQISCNREAQLLAPASADSLPDWLGESAPSYHSWNHRDALTLPISSAEHTASVTILPLADGSLFLLSGFQPVMAGKYPLAVAAQVLRQPLSDLHTTVQRLSEELEEMENPLFQEQSAAITRQVYRLSRITVNLADLEQIRNGTYPFLPQKIQLTDYLEELSSELVDLCRCEGRTLICSFPKKPIAITADPILLDRAVLNLLSNALKYGDKAKNIHFQVQTTPSAVLLKMCNACSAPDSDLLSAAFQRMNQRGVLPDPQWGLGLGLPMVQHIAKLMGGTVAVSVDSDQTASITMSISRKKQLDTVKAPKYPPMDYTGGMRRSLVELSDVLPNECFDSVSI